MATFKIDSCEFKLLFTVNNKEYYACGDKMIVLFPEEYPLSKVLAEAENQAFAYEAGIATPRVDEISSYEGRWAIVSALVGTELLSDVVYKRGMSDEMLEKFTSLQIAVHSKKSYDLHKQRENMHRFLGDAPLDPTIRYELHTLLDSLPKHNKLCHGAYLPSSVIASADGSLYVIDWSLATQGNASCDASYTYLSLLLDSGSELAERYLSSFCRKSEIAKDYVIKWESIVAASMLRGRSEEGQKILKNIIKK